MCPLRSPESTQAFAAASLGQVHRARLKSGEEVAVKVQYPGIARTIRADFRNLQPLLLPARFTRDWDSTREQIDYLRRSLERETDYEHEARSLEKARSARRRDNSPASANAASSLATRRDRKSDTSFSALTRRSAQGSPRRSRSSS